MLAESFVTVVIERNKSKAWGLAGGGEGVPCQRRLRAPRGR